MTTKRRFKKKSKNDNKLEIEFYEKWQEVRAMNSNPEVKRFVDIDESLKKSKEVKTLLDLRYKLYQKHTRFLKTFLTETTGCADGIAADTNQEIALAFLTYVFNYDPYRGYTLTTFMYRVIHGATMSAFYQTVYCVKNSIYLATNRCKVAKLVKEGLSKEEAYETLKLTTEQRWLLDNCKFHSTGHSPEKFLDDRLIAGYEDKLWILHKDDKETLLNALENSSLSEGLKSKLEQEINRGLANLDKDKIDKIYQQYLQECEA